MTDLITATSTTGRAPVSATAGKRLPTRDTPPVTQADIVRFAGAGGDFNPLHHDPAAAARAGFPGVIAMGQMQAGMLAAWLTDWCGVEHLLELDVRFRAPVRISDVVVFTGGVTDVRTGPDAALADLELTGAVDGAPVVQATAVVRCTRVERSL